MSIREPFKQGLTWDEYMGGIQKNQDLLKAKYEEVEISPEERAFFQSLKKCIYVLAIRRGLVPAVLRTITCRLWSA